MRHRLLTRIALTVACVVVPCLACPSATQTIAPAAQRAAAPDFTLDDSKGAPVTLSDYQGKVVLLDVWATWCTGCKVEIPWYMEFEKKYRRQGLSSIGVAMDEDGWKSVTPYLRKKPINYPIVVGDADFAQAYGVTSMPMTLLIDRKGRIADAHVGMVGKGAWEQEIRTLLRER
jgi:cytochrome c biogenesis protein CcmG/thiol:disulfide interchange protein DsbE